MKKILYPLALIGMLILAACGKPQNDNGLVFKQALGADITSTDPHIMEDNNSFSIALNAFEGLFRLNVQTAVTELGLAESYDVSPDGLVYTFILKEGLVFSDNTPITAQTFVDSWQRAIDPATNSGTAYTLADILLNGRAIETGVLPAEELGIKTLDARTLEVTLAFPAPYAKDIFALPIAVALPMHLIKNNPESWNHTFPVVSNGPFVITSWKPSSQVVMEKNPLYYAANEVQLDQIITYTLDDMNTAYNMYINKEIDFLALISPDRIDESQLRDDYHSDPFVNGYYFLFNMTRKPFDDLRVRQALNKSIDRKALTDKILRGGEHPLYALIPNMPNYRSQNYLEESVSEAQDLLAAAGFPGGNGFPNLTLTYNTSENNKKVAEFIQQQWKQNLGISIALQNQEWKTFLGTRANFDYDIIRMGWLPDYPDPIAMLNFLASKGGYSNYYNVDFDQQLESSHRISDSVRRMHTLEMAEARLMQDLPFIPVLSQYKNTLFDGSKWEGLYNNPANIIIFREVKLKV